MYARSTQKLKVSDRHRKRIDMTIFFLAAVPTFLYSWLLWSLDRYEREPLRLLAITFVWGAVPALLLAAFAEVGIGAVAGDRLAPGMDASLVAPLIEEPGKALA